MSLKQNQADHFNQWLEKIWSTLSSNNTSKNIIEQAKHDLLDLFLDDNLWLESHEQVDKAFDHVKQLLENKIQQTDNEDQKQAFNKLKSSIQRSQRTYNNPDSFINKQEVGQRTQQIKELYSKIKNISNHNEWNSTTENTNSTNIKDTNNEINQNVERTQSQQEKIGDFITQTPKTEESIKNEETQEENYLDKLLRQQEYINNLKEQFPDIKNNPDLIKILDEWKKLTLKDHNGTEFVISKDGEKYYAAESSGESPRGEIDTTIPLTTKKVVEYASNEIHNLFSIDTNLMDKENLIEESERNRIRDISERKYMEANWLQKVGMFGINRRRQNRELKKSMSSQRSNSNFIEQWNLQDRIEGNIGTYAQQNKMGIDWWKINRIDLWYDNEIDEIAHKFLMGNSTESEAIANFNYIFNRNPRLRMWAMTGTDIMAQLKNSNNLKNYKIKQLLIPFMDSKKTKLSDTDIASIQQQLNTNKINIVWNQVQANHSISTEEIISSFEQLKADMLTNNINQLTERTSKIRVKLRWLTKRPETEELEGVRYDRFYKQNKISKILERWWIWLNIWLKSLTGIALAATWPLWVFLGITVLGWALQRAKTSRDSIKEIAKTQEDAINMGMGELENRIAILSKEINKAQWWNKSVFKHFGMWSYHRNIKQLKILTSLQQMRWGANNTMVSVEKIINNLKTTSNDLTPLADVLARIDAGQQYQTHFISTTDANGKSLGRQQTAIKRHEMMNELQEACFRLWLIERKDNITSNEWKQVRSQLSSTPHYQDTIKRLSNTYEQVQQDIRTNKNSIARNAAGNYAKSAIAASVITAGVTWIIQGLNGSNTGQDIVKEIKPHEHTNYKLGKFDDNGIINNTNTSWLDQVHNGQTIEIQWESAVDAVKAHSSKSFWNYMDHIKETRELVSHSGLNKATQETLQNAISDKKIEEIMNIAKDAWADEWNRRLVVERWREGMENITEYLSKHNMKDVTIQDIVFDTDTAKMAMQSSTGGADATHRGFEAIVKIVEQKTNEVKEIPRSFPWQPWLLAALPFANTYALPGQQSDFASLNPQAVEQKRKRYELRKKQQNSQINRWENKYAS